MYNNYVLICCFLWPCWLVCFVVYFDYLLIQIMFQRMWRDEYLFYCSVSYIIRTDIELSVILYISCVDWLSRIAMIDVYVTLTPNSWQVWGYPHISGQNKKMLLQYGYDRSMPYMFEICVFGNSGYCRIPHQDFWLMQTDLCLGLELSMGNYAKFFSRWSLVPIRINYGLLGLGFSIDPVVQADTPIKQCCNFPRNSLAFETDTETETWKFGYHLHTQDTYCGLCRT